MLCDPQVLNKRKGPSWQLGPNRWKSNSNSYGLLKELALPWLLLTCAWPPRSLTPTLNQGTMAGPTDDLF